MHKFTAHMSERIWVAYFQAQTSLEGPKSSEQLLREIRAQEEPNRRRNDEKRKNTGSDEEEQAMEEVPSTSSETEDDKE